MYRIGLFFVLLKFEIFFGVLEIPDIYFGRTVDAGSQPTYAGKIRVSPPHTPGSESPCPSELPTYIVYFFNIILCGDFSKKTT